jgi:type 1 glutamine amidotransferase
MDRRTLLKSGLVALTLGAADWPLGWAAAADKSTKRILMFTRSQTYQHDVVKRQGDKLSLAEQTVTDLGKKHGFEVVCEKDGRVFLSRDFYRFDGFLFETQGDLSAEKSLDDAPPVPPEGKTALLDAVDAGKAFVGCHCASDTYHSKGDRWQTQSRDAVDPYIAMVGGEFAGHGAQQKARMHLADLEFPGAKGHKDFELNEEWYSLKNFAPDLHVILVQETQGMVNFDYERPSYPATWARRQGKGRVFYTSMGHREDVWQNPVFHEVLLGGLAWALGHVNADVTPNIDKVTPKANDLPRKQ